MIEGIMKCSMEDSEIKLFEDVVKNSKEYLEFGSGGSTFNMLSKTNANVYSVESDNNWINKLKEYSIIDKAITDNRLILKFNFIGEVEKWGVPVDDKFKDLFPNYSSDIFDVIDGKKIDTVLIDGRFRVACCLKTIEKLYKNDNLKIIIHDFWNRARYHILLNYLDEVGRDKTLGVFTIKKNIDFIQLKKDYDESKYNSA